MSQPTFQHALQQAYARGVARLDSQWLLLHVLNKPVSDRAWLLAHDTDPLTAEQTLAYTALIERRAGGEPLAYLVGSKAFFGLNLAVDRRVLVPRPETETLVHWSLDVLTAMASANTHAVLDILDLGTGSGAVALALAHTLHAQSQAARVLAVDASADALQVAAHNAEALGLAVGFLHSNWLARVDGRFHLIASNPPYVAAADPHLAALHHEPVQALAAGADGADDLRAIIAQAPAHLVDGGWLLLEHGYDQSEIVCELLRGAGFSQVASRLDLAGISRCSGGQWSGRAHAANSEIISSS